ncbi:MAG: hypothetical protein JXR49_05160 [Acidobacteria bacterium]|nr:hypothetical protein [Acidobacteriota bacterium]
MLSRGFSNTKTRYWFIALLTGVLLNIWLFQNRVLTREVYHALLSDRMESYRIDDYFNSSRKLSVIQYLAAPLILLMKTAVLALFLQFPLTLKLINISFFRIYRAVILAEIPLLASSLIRTLWLMARPVSEIHSKAMMIAPLSLASILRTESYPVHSLSLFNHINIFEAAWLFIITKNLSDKENLSRSDAFLMVLVVWMFIILFEYGLIMYLQKISG